MLASLCEFECVCVCLIWNQTSVREGRADGHKKGMKKKTSKCDSSFLFFALWFHSHYPPLLPGLKSSSSSSTLLVNVCTGSLARPKVSQTKPNQRQPIQSQLQTKREKKSKLARNSESYTIRLTDIYVRKAEKEKNKGNDKTVLN